MSTDSNEDSDELTVESLSRDKSEIFSEHGLENTALGKAVDKQAAEAEEKLTKHQQIVDAKVTLAQAHEAGVDDPAVEALAEAVGEFSEETEAAALVEHAEKVEAREKIAELESLANSTEGASSASFEQKAAALREKHGLEEEPGRYEAEALVDQPDAEDPDTEALVNFREKQATREADEKLPQEARELISQLKNMRELAKQNGSEAAIERYSERIEDVRAKHDE